MAARLQAGGRRRRARRPRGGRALLCQAWRGRRGRLNRVGYRQGAHGFRGQSRWARRVGAFINLESTGPGGPDFVFQARAPRTRLRQPPCRLQPADTDPTMTLELERCARKRDVSAARAGQLGAGQGRTGALRRARRARRAPNDSASSCSLEGA